ncbi:hypothetical protein VTL71DRAFT_14126 [Oculimacula yallundae]|uniref:Zn(2)-C6 fungal-type domain-containing protein n=1 Tax=Oculimacula yallundae TaxID=86028 RepID=A0ABR4CIA5_9HELO
MSAPDLSPDDLGRPPQPPKSQRVLACILCQQRKVKCDRKHPCANCVKARAQCVPATQVTRQRKRRFPERELLDRLRRYEDLMRRNNIDFDPLHKESSDKISPKVEGGEGDDSDDEPPKNAPVDRPSPATTTSSEILHQPKNILHAMSQEFRDPDNHSNSSDDDVREIHIRKAMEQIIRSDDHLLFGLSKSSVDISTFHPEPIHIFKLWQLYLDNVNPLLKVTHTPSVQGRIIEAASNLSNIEPPLEALMFSIYCMATLSLSEDDCLIMFASTRQEMLVKYQFGCQQALLNCEFLRTTDRECLTALFLYLVSVRPGTVPQSLSSMLGIATRIAQRMGIDKEAVLVKKTPLEAELCRRLWWGLVLFDGRVGEMAGARAATLNPIWDCKVPLNVAEADLRPQMKDSPQALSTSSDSIFAAVRSEVADFVRFSKWHLDFSSPALLPVALEHRRHPVTEGSEMGSLETLIEEKYLAVCDPEIPLHFMTIWTARGLLAKCRLLEHYSKASSMPRAQADTAREAAFLQAITMLECDTKLNDSPLTLGFRWMVNFYYPFPAYIQAIQNLKRQPLSPLAKRAWEALNDNYDAHHSMASLHDGMFYNILAPVTLQAWAAREEISIQMGEPSATPRIISHIRHVLQQRAQPSEAIHQQSVPDMDMNAFSMSAPMNFDQNMFFGMGGQQSFPAPGPWGSPDIMGMPPLNVDPNQLDWSSMDWNLGSVPPVPGHNSLGGQSLRF